jgi:hypothetical protein
MHALQHENDDDRRLSMQNSVNRKLAKLKPGTSSCLQAMLAPDGTLATSHEAMAELLRSHWAQIFTAPEADTELVDAWAAKVCRRTTALAFAPAEAAWEPTRATLDRALRGTSCIRTITKATVEPGELRQSRRCQCSATYLGALFGRTGDPSAAGVHSRPELAG